MKPVPQAKGLKRPRTRRRAAAERPGLAVVEFALIAPIFIFLTIAMVEFARGYHVREVLSDAARKACRGAVLPTGANSTITSDINSILTSNNISTSNVTITVQVNGTTADATTAKQNDKVSVKVAVPVSSVAWITPLFLPGQKLVSETVTMMRN
jgi:Flp pilus assembly protein TadG